MAAVDLHHQHLQRRWAQEQELVEERRQRLLVTAGQAAEALRERWPVVRGAWLFGSALEASSFHRHSDLDLSLIHI